uniref:helix-turn-helix domain-containing protein n=1 Tax=Paraburkholderia aspalathi TaxID=1324617 RepID=UPI0038BC6B26
MRYTGKIYEHLSAEERGVIFPMKMENHNSSKIALTLQHSRSTNSRELRRVSIWTSAALPNRFLPSSNVPIQTNPP